jgi:hypothetical protein
VLAEIPLASYWQADMCDVKQYLAGKFGGEHGVFASFLYPFFFILFFLVLQDGKIVRKQENKE